jgi:hypothetical protein
MMIIEASDTLVPSSSAFPSSSFNSSNSNPAPRFIRVDRLVDSLLFSGFSGSKYTESALLELSLESSVLTGCTLVDITTGRNNNNAFMGS